jgi:hypothetical protein
MKSIKFTDQEIDFLQKQYLIELEEAEKYVESIKNLLDKLGNPKPKKVLEPVEKIPTKRGRKPKVVKEEVVVEVIKKKRKPRKDKGNIRVKPIKPVLQEIKPQEPVLTAVESKPDKTLVPKKKVKKRRNYKRKGIYLAPLSKPLKKKPIVETSPPTEITPEKVE